MFINHHDEFTRARLLRRVRDAFPRSVVATGTRAADIVADALLADARLARADARRIGELSDAAIVRTFCDVIGGVDAGVQRGFELPFGSIAEISRPGGLCIGGEEWVTDAGRPGLHRMEAVRRDAHGPNLRMLRDMISKRTRKLACRHIGLPMPKLIIDHEARELLQFPPFEAAGGVALQRGAYESGAERFCAATPKQISRFAADIVADMRTLWTRRHAIAARIGAVRTAAEAGAASARASGEDVSVALLTIDLRGQRDADHFAVSVEYRGLDEALRVGTLVKRVPWNWLPEHGDLDPPRTALRAKDAAELARLGADGRICGVARGLASVTPEEVSGVLRTLATEYSFS